MERCVYKQRLPRTADTTRRVEQSLPRSRTDLRDPAAGWPSDPGLPENDFGLFQAAQFVALCNGRPRKHTDHMELASLKPDFSTESVVVEASSHGSAFPLND